MLDAFIIKFSFCGSALLKVLCLLFFVCPYIVKGDGGFLPIIHFVYRFCNIFIASTYYLIMYTSNELSVRMNYINLCDILKYLIISLYEVLH